MPTTQVFVQQVTNQPSRGVPRSSASSSLALARCIAAGSSAVSCGWWPSSSGMRCRLPRPCAASALHRRGGLRTGAERNRRGLSRPDRFRSPGPAGGGRGVGASARVERIRENDRPGVGSSAASGANLARRRTRRSDVPCCGLRPLRVVCRRPNHLAPVAAAALSRCARSRCSRDGTASDGKVKGR